MNRTRSMTEGTPWKLIVSFAVPLLIGQIVQIFYNIVDTRVIGSGLGELALASVGSVSSLYTLLTSFANGLTLGFSLIMAMYFGAKKEKDLKKAYAANIWLSLLISAVTTISLLVFLQPILHILNVPEEELAMSTAYIRILIIGLFVTTLYNMFANTLRAIGDSLTPLIFLIIALGLNVVLDLLFVLSFGMGVWGAALATVLAQILSVVLCFIRVRRKFPILHVKKEDFRLSGNMLGELLKSGFSMALMFSLVGFGTVTLQSAINQMGTTIIVAHTAARRIQEIVVIPNIVLSSAMATFSGQNYGAGRPDRIRTGLKSVILIGAVWCGVILLILWFASGALVGFLASTSNPDIIYWGTTYTRINVSFLFVCLNVSVLRNTLQGLGNRKIPVISSVIELGGKVVFAFWLAPLFGYWGVIWCEPIIWILMVIPLLIQSVRTLSKTKAPSPE